VDVWGEAIWGWGLKLPPQDGWISYEAQRKRSAEVGRALALLALALPVTPLQIPRRYPSWPCAGS
jgi:hypothetical protein